MSSGRKPNVSLRSRPIPARGLRLLGRTLYSLSWFEAALRAYEKDSRPFRSKTLLGMALALEALNRDSDSENMYREAIRSGDRQAPVDYEKFRRKRHFPGVSSPEIQLAAKDLRTEISADGACLGSAALIAASGPGRPSHE